jgi:hypothetical protein
MGTWRVCQSAPQLTLFLVVVLPEEVTGRDGRAAQRAAFVEEHRDGLDDGDGGVAVGTGAQRGQVHAGHPGVESGLVGDRLRHRGRRDLPPPPLLVDIRHSSEQIVQPPGHAVGGALR